MTDDHVFARPRRRLTGDDGDGVLGPVLAFTIVLLLVVTAMEVYVNQYGRAAIQHTLAEAVRSGAEPAAARRPASERRTRAIFCAGRWAGASRSCAPRRPTASSPPRRGSSRDGYRARCCGVSASPPAPPGKTNERRSDDAIPSRGRGDGGGHRPGRMRRVLTPRRHPAAGAGGVPVVVDERPAAVADDRAAARPDAVDHQPDAVRPGRGRRPAPAQQPGRRLRADLQEPPCLSFLAERTPRPRRPPGQRRGAGHASLPEAGRGVRERGVGRPSFHRPARRRSSGSRSPA